MDLYKIAVIGRVQPRDPEARFTADGRNVTTFRIVANRQRRGRDGERVDEAEWFQVTAFGRLAETVTKHITKGSRVYVSGRFSSRVWQDTNGKDRTSLEILANEVLRLDWDTNTEPRHEAAPGTSDQAADLDEIPW